jgi:predicted RND superfamily exporter protein
VLLGIVALTALAATGLVDPRDGSLRVRIDPSVDRLLPADDEERIFYERTRHVYGGDETLVVALAGADVFRVDTLRRVERLSQRLRRVPGVHHVLSLATAPNLRSDADGLDVRSFTAHGIADPGALERLRHDVFSNPLYRGTLVSDDARATALVVYFKRLSDREFLDRGIAEQIAEIARSEAGPGEVWVSGAPVLKAATSRALMRELSFTLPMIAVLGGGVLLLAFGSLLGVLLPLLSIALSLVWTLGSLGWLGRPLDLVTVIVPPLVITVGVAYAMHVVSEFFAASEGDDANPSLDARERVRRCIASVGFPVSVTALTTIAGLLALVLSPLGAIREFGLLAALGVFYTLVLSMTFLPAGLGLLGGARDLRAPPGAALFAASAHALVQLALRRRRAVLAAGVALLLLSLLGATRIRVGAEYVRNFPADAPVRVEFEAVNAAFRGANAFSVVVETNLRDAFTHPDQLRALETLQAWLEEQPEIGATRSVVDHLKLLNRGLQGDPEEFRLPDDQRLAKQLLVFGGGEELEAYVDSLFHSARVAVQVNVSDSASVGALLERVEQRLAQLPLPLQARVTGSSVLVNRTVERIARGQLASIAAALGVIYLILSALFTSFRVGLLALLPNALPIAVYFGALGLTGVTLNPATSLVACIALGIAVDDTIHYLVRFNAEARRTGSERMATFRALGGLIRPVTFTTLALCAGFLALTASELRTQVQFGSLAAFTLAVAWLVDVTLTPALCAGVRIVTLWDVLRLDLGDDPQHSVPLFQGLSLREARIFALLADIRELSAGERLIQQGDRGRDMFVVIDGELAVWLERDGARLDLDTQTRGAVVGQVSLFDEPRTAHVDARTRARLLRFTDDDLEHLLRRYPRIAAIVYRNLNRSQAMLVSDTTRRLR